MELSLLTGVFLECVNEGGNTVYSELCNRISLWLGFFFVSERQKCKKLKVSGVV